MKELGKEHSVEQRVTAVRSLVAATLLAGALLAGVAVANPAQAHAAQKSSVVAANNAGSVSKIAATSSSTSFKSLGKQTRSVKPITRKKARKIALDDACYKKKQVKKLKVRPGSRSGQEAFVVTFKFKKVKYSYAIAKWGGGIISRSAHMTNAKN